MNPISNAASNQNLIQVNANNNNGAQSNSLFTAAELNHPSAPITRIAVAAITNSTGNAGKIPEAKGRSLKRGSANVRTGIVNATGNDCFLISAMQLLFHSGIYGSLIDQQGKNALKKSSHKWIKEFESFSDKYCAGDSQLRVDKFRELLGFSSSAQEDAAETIHKILTPYKANFLGSKFNYRRKINPANARKLIPGFPDKIDQYSKINKDNCINNQTYLITLDLEISAQDKTFQGQLNQFFSSKIQMDPDTPFVFLNEENSFFHIKSYEEQCLPIELKDNLIVTLKRFDATGKKNATGIDFKNGECTIGDKKYQLQGFIQHIGNDHTRGHYVAYCQSGNEWHYYDDNQTPMSKTREEILRAAKNAYIISLVAI